MMATDQVLLLSDVVTASAFRDPDAEAVRSGDGQLTYSELAEATDRLASTLHALGVQRGDRVGVYLHKSVAAFVALHGVLRSGAAFVPIDPFSPPQAVATIVDDCGIEVVVSESRLAGGLEQLVPHAPGLRAVVGPDAPVEGLVTVDSASCEGADPLSPSRILPEDLAYVMYTSGSTGRPKGLMHTHRSGLAYAALAAETHGIRPDDRLANSAPFHFDISTFELFAGPLAGASTLVIPEPYLKMPASLSQLVADDRSTFWYSVPFLLAELLARGALAERDLTSIRWVLFGGEVADPAILTELMAYMPNARFSNVYGPAEVNACTYHHLDGPPAADQPVPIGRPWRGSEVMVVDDDHELVPAGEVGELLVRSSTMMDGYWGRDDLNENVFVDLSLAGGRVGRWLATGDLVRERPNGELEFIGRRDHQVKVRGNRVELESVEAVLMGIDGVEQAVAGVVAIEDTTALVAGIATRDGVALDTDEMLEALARVLPPYAIPFRLLQLDELPLTGSGKVDRRLVRLRLAERCRNEGVSTP